MVAQELFSKKVRDLLLSFELPQAGFVGQADQGSVLCLARDLHAKKALRLCLLLRSAEGQQNRACRVDAVVQIATEFGLALPFPTLQ